MGWQDRSCRHGLGDGVHWDRYVDALYLEGRLCALIEDDDRAVDAKGSSPSYDSSRAADASLVDWCTVLAARSSRSARPAVNRRLGAGGGKQVISVNPSHH